MGIRVTYSVIHIIGKTAEKEQNVLIEKMCNWKNFGGWQSAAVAVHQINVLSGG